MQRNPSSNIYFFNIWFTNARCPKIIVKPCLYFFNSLKQLKSLKSYLLNNLNQLMKIKFNLRYHPKDEFCLATYIFLKPILYCMTRSNEVHNKNNLLYYSNHELTLRHFKKYSMPWPLRNRSQQLAASSVTFHIVDQATSRTSSHILRSTRSSISRSIFCNR